MTAREHDRTGDERTLPAPELRETADIWWDSGVDPVIRWNAAGTRFWLADGTDETQMLHLLDVAAGADDPMAVAQVLRDGLAACDFPPTGDGVSPHRVAATLRAARLDP